MQLIIPIIILSSVITLGLIVYFIFKQKCKNDFYINEFNEGKCTPCTTCGVDEKMVTDCTETKDRVCEKITTTCGQDQYLNVGGDCTPCTTCGGDEKMVKDCSEREDTVCCGQNQYLNVGGDCTPCTTCGDGEKMVKDCSDREDTVCEKITTTCGQNQYLNDNGDCIACTTCGDGEKMVTGCTDTKDTVCENICETSRPFTISPNRCIDVTSFPEDLQNVPECLENILTKAGVTPSYIDSCDFLYSKDATNENYKKMSDYLQQHFDEFNECASPIKTYVDKLKEYVSEQCG